MKKRNRHIVLLVIALFVIALSPITTYGQISSLTADHSKPLDYPIYNEESAVFVFYQMNGNIKQGSLTATPPDTGSFIFDWSRYDTESQTFIPYHTDMNMETSTIQDLNEGGYQVRIWNGTVDTTFLAWVMLNGLVAETEKTADGKVRPYKYTCDFLVMTGFVFIDTFYYYDPVSFDTLKLENDFHFKWTSDNPDLDIPGDTIFLSSTTFAPPVIDTWYVLTARDDLGMTDVDSVLYESIHTKAEFTVEYFDKINDLYDPSLTGNWSLETGSLDALLTVKFINESVNGVKYEWVYLDTIGSIKENEFTEDVETAPEHTYENANKYYYPYMVSVSEADCKETFRLEEAIHVVPSQLGIPNVFSPNGDNINDVFIFKHQSLKSCKLTIADRFGSVVYKMETDDIYSWEGWDGTVRNSSRMAPEGQYYFIIQATGYDGKEYSDPTIFNKSKNNTTSGSGSTGGTAQDPEESTGGLYTGWLYIFRGSGSF